MRSWGSWLAPGGMRLFCNGYPLLLCVLAANSYELTSRLPVAAQRAAPAVLLIACLLAKSASPKVYFWLTVPMFSLALPLGLVLPHAALLYAWAFLLMQIKVGVCMSCCLHRYAAHAAFKCGPLTSLVVGCIGCFANQGGPIWWASKHRAHHTFCDGPSDPHSVMLMGEIEAFAFFTRQQSVDEDFAPSHIDHFGMRLIDTYAIAFPLLECLMSWMLLGPGGVWASLASAFLAQTLTLYFNLANHPPGHHTPAAPSTTVSTSAAPAVATCLATDRCVYQPANVFLHCLSYLFPFFEYLGGAWPHAQIYAPHRTRRLLRFATALPHSHHLREAAARRADHFLA